MSRCEAGLGSSALELALELDYLAAQVVQLSLGGRTDGKEPPGEAELLLGLG